MQKLFQWESVHMDNNSHTSIAWAPRGWLVREQFFGESESVSICFVADESHAWNPEFNDERDQ